MQTLLTNDDLFNTLEYWNIDPVKAFDALVANIAFVELSHRKLGPVDKEGKPRTPMPVRASTAKVYMLMWRKLVRWLQEEQIPVLSVTSADLVRFLEQKDENGKRILSAATIRRQYLTLVERVYRHLQIQPNPASSTVFDIARNRTSGIAGRNQPKVVITLAQQQAFMDALPNVVRDARNPVEGWKTRRDRAMMALMLGAGLKVSEVLGVYPDNIGRPDAEGNVPVTISPAAAGGVVRWHQTMLRAFAAQPVLDWVEEWQSLKIMGSLLFPRTLQGGKLNKVTAYRFAKATFAAAGIDVPRQGGRTLRNAYAVRELKAGQTVEAVGEMLGHRVLRSMEDYVEAKARLDHEALQVANKLA